MPKQNKGFRRLSPERRKEVASMGGKAATNRHKWSSEEARLAGLKGGANSVRTRRSKREQKFSDDIEE